MNRHASFGYFYEVTRNARTTNLLTVYKGNTKNGHKKRM